MGFKLKWFRHRLTFDQLPTSTSSASFSSSTSSSPTGLFRRSKSEAVIVTGYYRRSLDEELAENHAPREFPPIKARAKSQPPSKGITSAPSMPTLTETSPPQQLRTAEKSFEIKKVPLPAQQKEAAPLPRKQENTRIPVIQREEAPEPAKTIVEAHIPPKQTEAPNPTEPAKQRALIAVNYEEIPIQFQKKEAVIPNPQKGRAPETVKYEDIEIRPQEETPISPQRKEIPPLPPQRKESPIPPVPPKRKENRPKEVINEPPPVYSEEDTIKLSSKDTMIDRVLIVDPPAIIKQHTESNVETTLNSPPPEMEMDFPTPLLRTILDDKPKSPEIRPQPRPHTLPSIVIDDSKPTATIAKDTPPPLPKSAPPMEDPKPWFEIEEEILDNTLTIVARNSEKNAIAPEAPAARTSNPTDELPVLGSTTDLRSKPKVTGNPKPTTQNGTPSKSQETTPTPAQKSSKVRAFFGFGSPSASPEPPKPKTRRIRVPKQKSPKNSPKPLPRTISVTSTDIDSTPNNPPSPKQVKQTIQPPTYDTPLTIRPGKPPSPGSLPVPPPARKTKSSTNSDKGPKQLSFAETATVFSEDDEISVTGQTPDADEGDSWDLVAKHRANINQNATQVKAAARRPRAAAVGTEKRVDFVPIDRPRTMREMRKSQSTGAGVNLKNKDNANDSDTEA